MARPDEGSRSQARKRVRLEAAAESGVETMRLRREPLIRRPLITVRGSARHLLPQGEEGRHAPTLNSMKNLMIPTCVKGLTRER
jgi:hypothetical protein